MYMYLCLENIVKNEMSISFGKLALIFAVECNQALLF